MDVIGWCLMGDGCVWMMHDGCDWRMRDVRIVGGGWMWLDDGCNTKHPV